MNSIINTLYYVISLRFFQINFCFLLAERTFFDSFSITRYSDSISLYFCSIIFYQSMLIFIFFDAFVMCDGSRMFSKMSSSRSRLADFLFYGLNTSSSCNRFFIALLVFLNLSSIRFSNQYFTIRFSTQVCLTSDWRKSRSCRSSGVPIKPRILIS